MKNLLRVPTVLLLASIGLTGCAGLQPTPMYRLDSGTTEVPERIDGAAVLLAPVTLADYLQRDALLQRLADGSLAADDQQARWAGSLKADIEQLMLRQLAWRLDTRKAWCSVPPTKASRRRYRSSCPSPASIPGLRSRRYSRRSGVCATRPAASGQPSGAPAGRAPRHHRRSGARAERPAAAPERGWPGRSSPRWSPRRRLPAPAKPQVSKSAEPPAPRIPAAEPIRTDLEVFRF